MRRRSFIRNTAGTVAAVIIGETVMGSQSGCATAAKTTSSPFQTGFEQSPLPYGYDALEKIIDTRTMDIHYNKHAAAYAKNLQEAALAEKADMKQPLENLLPVISRYSAKMRNNAGGHYNHELFWKCMKPVDPANGQAPEPSGKLREAIDQHFGSFSNFKTQFSDAAKNRFGSGWAWLYMTSDKKLKTGSTPNQDNPLMDVSDIRGNPLLGLDVWEHAYYLNYQNKRADYVNNWWALVNWDFVQQRFLTS